MQVRTERPHLTTWVDLPGGQERLRQMILYVSEKCAGAPYFGRIKLNKILWKADFDAFAARGRPVTGRPYQRLALGPAPREMKPLLDEMSRDGVIHFELTDFGDEKVEHKPVADATANLSLFDENDLSFVDRSIKYYWQKSGTKTSDDSHGVAWRSRSNGDPMYYELSFLSDSKINDRQLRSIAEFYRRQIIFSKEFEDACKSLGGIQAIDVILEPLIDGLQRDPWGFDKVEGDFYACRYVITKPVIGMPALLIYFSIDANNNVVLDNVEPALKY